MTQALHYANVKHTTCQTAKGQRRSPVAGVSYDSDMELLDMVTGRKLYRPHHDGTEVIYSEIFSDDPNCPYADKSTDLQERRQNLWNDLYKENKSNKERHRCYGEVAIPNNITDEEMKELATRLGNYFCTTFKRPVDISLHKKHGNNHIHFSLPEREYKKGKWLPKRKKYYKDMDGKLIKDKIYKDANGWDIRKPKINKKLVPKGADPYERNPETGDYLYQKLGERNKKQWEEDTREGKFLEPEELSKMHNSIDDVVNTFLHEQGYDITVRRNRPEVTKKIKELGIKQIRVSTSDYKMHTSAVEEIRQKNEYNRQLQRAIEENLDEVEQAEINVLIAEDEEEKAEALANLYTEDRKAGERKLAEAEADYQETIKKYVENELHPEEIFIADYMQPYQEALNFKEKQCAAADEVLTSGISKTDTVINELEQKEERTDRENNKLQFMKENKSYFVSVAEEVSRIRKSNKSASMRQAFRNKWNGLTGWQRASYIYTNVSKNAGLLYRDYLITTGVIRQKKNPDFSLPAKITSEAAFTGVINGKAVPGIKSKFDKNLTATQNAENAAAESLERWKENVNQEIPLPPTSSDFEFLTLANTVPERVRELNTQPDNLHYFKVQMKDYQPEKSQEDYLARESEITAAEEKAKAWNWEKCWELEQNAKQKTETLLLPEIQQAAFVYDLNESTKKWESFQKLEEPYLKANQAYKDFKEAEDKTVEEYRNRRFSFLYEEYQPDEYKIDYLKRIADNKLAALKKVYPDYPHNCPEEPNPHMIKYNVAQEFKDMKPEDIIAAAEELELDKEKILECKAAVQEAQNYLADKPENPASGQNAQRTQSKNESRSLDEKGKKPYTGR